LATFFIVQAGLLGCTIETLGSEEQKAKYLPKIINLEWIGGWGLTEDKIGSDATNIETKVTKSSEGYTLNGVKRWMGNGNKDLLIVWAKNEQKLVEGFILETHSNPQGWKS
jgi:acyl-CoA oxidase